MTDLLPTGRHSKLNPEEKRRAFLALIGSGGNSAEASKHLATQGIDVPAGTLRVWKSRYPDEYAELARKYGPEIEALAVDNYREMLPAIQAAQALALAKTVEQLHNDKIDASQAMQRLAVAGGVTVDKLRVLTDRPTHIVEQRTGDDAIRTLEHHGLITEIPDAELVDDNSNDGASVAE